MVILAFDPAGNFKEGSGVTGWSLFEDQTPQRVNVIRASQYISAEEYWFGVGCLISHFNADVVVCEDFRLFAHKAKQQSWSSMETPQLIGYLRMECWRKGIPFILQDPSCKARFSDDILVNLEILQKSNNRLYFNDRVKSKPLLTNDHMRDAIRHGMFFTKYGKAV